MDPMIARKTWRTLEVYHGFIYFSPDALERYKALGLSRMSGYFASRSAGLGAASAELIIATFFNFHPKLVRDSMEGVWDKTTPADVHAARIAAVDDGLTRMLGDDISSDNMKRAAELASTAARETAKYPEGRPLFAGHLTLPWPNEPHLVLWHSQMLLREFRGDGHIAALTVQGLNGLEALIMHAAKGEVSRKGVQMSRVWSDEEWEAGCVGLQERGWLDAENQFTAEGQEQRQWAEDRTDQLALAPYAALGEEACAELRQLGRPWSKAIMEAGALGR